MQVTTEATYTKPTSSPPDASTVKIFAMCISVYNLIFLILLVTIHCYERVKIHSFSGEIIHRISPYGLKQPTCASILSPSSCSGGRSLYGVLFSLLTFLYFFSISGSAKSILKFLMESSCIHVLLNNSAELVWQLSFLGSRTLSVLLTYFLPAHYLVFAHLFGQFVCVMFLTLCEESDHVTQYIMLGVLAFSVAVLSPAFLSWANLYVEMRGTSISLALIGCSSGVITYYITACDMRKNSFSRLILASSVFSILVFSVAYFVSTKQGQRADSVAECDQTSIGTEEEELHPVNKETKKVSFIED